MSANFWMPLDNKYKMGLWIGPLEMASGNIIVWRRPP